jgi:hemerythrin superfamily protein
MDPIDLLRKQHRQLEALFRDFEDSEEADVKQDVLLLIADRLAVHTTIEERFFYPLLGATGRHDEVEEAIAEHAEVKKLVLDCMQSLESPGFAGKVAALKGALLHHIREEENGFFDRVRERFDAEVLDDTGENMARAADDLQTNGTPRVLVRIELEHLDIG